MLRPTTLARVADCRQVALLLAATVIASCSGGGGGHDLPAVDPPLSLDYGVTQATYTVGVPIPENIPAVVGGVPDSFSVTPLLPAGLSLSPSTGIISGTPVNVAPERSCVVTARNAGGSAQATLILRVVSAPPSPPSNLEYAFPVAEYTVDVAISPNVPSVLGLAVFWSVTPALPAGLALDLSTGVISGIPTLPTPTEVYTVTAANSGGSTSATVSITVLDPPGWLTSAGGTDSDRLRGMAALPDGSFLVTGNYESSATFGLGEPGETTITSLGDDDMFVARYNPDGTLAWARSAGGSGIDFVTRIDAFPDESFMITGWFGGTSIFGQGEPNQSILLSLGVDDVFIARYGSDGALQWARREGGPLLDRGRAVAALDDGTCVAAGSYRGATLWGAGGPNATTLPSFGGSDELWIARYDSAGALLWAKAAGATSNDRPSDIHGFADGSTLLTGIFENEAIFGQGEPNQTTMPNAIGDDLFVARYNPDGTLAWADRLAWGGSDQQSSSISAWPDGSFLLTGTFGGETTFLGGPTYIVPTSANTEGFIANYDASRNFLWIQTVTGPAVDAFSAAAILDDGTIATVGTFNDQAVFFEGTPAAVSIQASGQYDFFLTRLSAEGNPMWLQTASSTGGTGGIAVDRAPSDMILIGGRFYGTSSLFLGDPMPLSVTSQGGLDAFLGRVPGDGILGSF